MICYLIGYICEIITNLEDKMILEIRLSNFFSIKDEVVLDMQAASIQTKKQRNLKKIHLYVVMSGCLKLLPFMVQMPQERAVLSRLFALVWE